MQHGLLTVVKAVEGKRWWLARCECGKTKEVRFSEWGRHHSCGCTPKVPPKTKRHGRGDPLNSRWHNIKQRIFNPNCKSYPIYGGRGLTMDPSWSADVDKFAEDVGECPGKGWELDRIDNDIGYHPGNVRWVRRAANQRNQRRTVLVSVDSKEVPLAWLAREADVDYYVLYAANRRGEDIGEFLRRKGVDTTSICDNFDSVDWYAADADAVGTHRRKTTH